MVNPLSTRQLYEDLEQSEVEDELYVASVLKRPASATMAIAKAGPPPFEAVLAPGCRSRSTWTLSDEVVETGSITRPRLGARPVEPVRTRAVPVVPAAPGPCRPESRLARGIVRLPGVRLHGRQGDAGATDTDPGGS